jgi:signal transduction histidine kinase
LLLLSADNLRSDIEIMQNTMTKMEGSVFVRRLKFPREIERDFQESYFRRMRPTIRAAIFLIAGLSLLWSLIYTFQEFEPDFSKTQLFVLGIASLLCFLLVGFSFRREFGRCWQQVAVGATLIPVAAPLFFGDAAATPVNLLFFLLIGSRIQRLQFRAMGIQLLAVLLLSIIAVTTDKFGQWTDIGFTIQKVEGGWNWQLFALMLLVEILLMAGPLWWTLRTERFERIEFLTKYLLTQERDEERQKREHSEQMLRVMSRAIGGIVHDLGNPLTAVQGGAESLAYYMKEGDLDPVTAQEFLEMITDGARMLNFLRLSLIEQTRVLEGQPVPVVRDSISILHLVKAGAHYQKPRFATGRTVTFEGADLEVCVDEMRFITIFMNLIGNALKYSDGEIRIVWRVHEEMALISVQDQGIGGQGVSKAQAEKLFVAFGRLDTHAQIEGTGLGLLSVQKIAEAHGGEVFLEGFTDGHASSPRFCTAKGGYPAMLEAGFQTAFVVACPVDGVVMDA